MAVEVGTKRSVLSTTQLITIIILTGLLGGLISAYFGHRLLKSMGPGGKANPLEKYDEPDPDERPPIIVNNGTVFIEPHNGKKGRGSWDGSGRNYTHNFTGTTLPARFLQLRANLVADAQGNEHELGACTHSSGAAGLFTPITVAKNEKLELDYIIGGKTRTIRFRLSGNGAVAIDFPNDANAPGHNTNYAKLKVESDEDTPWVIRAGDFTCTYGQKSGEKVTVRILQLK